MTSPKDDSSPSKKSTPANSAPEIQTPSCLWAGLQKFSYVIPLMGVTVAYFPRLFLNFLVAILAQLCRLISRMFFTARPPQRSNKRILIITDYLPPQTHGIAIRLEAYIQNFRAQGHEVIVFSTARVEVTPSLHTSFDHPNLPSVVNPFNRHNRISYTPGLKLAFYLSAYSWDVVHLVCPSLIGIFVLPICCLRQIPTYCSHHVAIDQYAVAYAHGLVAQFGKFMYNVLAKWPSMNWGTINAAPTFSFLKSHLDFPQSATPEVRRIPSGTHDVFRPEPGNGQDAKTERQMIRSIKFNVDSDDTPVWLMVQRLAPEKGTRRIFDSIRGLDGVLVIAGDGPEKERLKFEAQQLGVTLVLLGSVPHHDLPQLYRSADIFVTMSTSETYGLTVVESLQCGCPVAIPHCAVFDELWSTRVPKDWFYDVTKPEELASVLKVAPKGGRAWLTDHPVKASWKMAADELMTHYDEAIAFKKRGQKLRYQYTLVFDHVLRMFFISAGFAFIGRRYYKTAEWFMDLSGLGQF